MPQPKSDKKFGRVLVVDDNPTNIDVLFDYLADLGYEVLVAEDGLSAIERIHFAKPDIILLDIMMPHLDGYGTCERLKADPETAGIPIIFMTALDSIGDKVKGFRAGAVDYITKPFQNEEVSARVDTHLTLRRMGEALRQRNEQLSIQNDSLDTYARTVAHDLKNPLNLIINFARLIEEESVLSGHSLQDLRMIIKSGERMNHIIHDLLLLAQMRQDNLAPVRIHMASVVRQSLDRLESDLKEAHVDLKQPKQWPDAMGHSAWIQAVWVNYISNAIKYGGSPPRIVLQAGPDPLHPGSILFSVCDNGIGVPANMQHKIFEEFSRVGGEQSEGHGIGLSIVRRIITRLGGRVGVTGNGSEPGSTFFFTLPAADKT